MRRRLQVLIALRSSLAFLSLYIGCCICSCDFSTPVEPGLKSLASGTPVPSNCASCHQYPVGGVNHQFHLLHADSLKNGNGPITCLDCHSSSLAERDEIILDSVFTNLKGKTFSSYDSGFNAAFRDSISRGRYVLSKVDTLVHHRPVPLEGPAQRITFLREWMTAGDHLNGVVDVKFDIRNSNVTRYKGGLAAFDPNQETCSAVACHTHDTPYRWPAPSKGLTGLNADNTTQ
jgi:hypothetical protein